MTAVADPPAEPTAGPATAGRSGPTPARGVRHGVRRPTSSSTRYTAGAIVAVTIGVVGSVPGVPGPLSALLLAVFVGVGPGCAALAWVGKPHVSRLIVVPALGLAFTVLVTGVAATVGWWHPRAAFSVLALTTLWSTLPGLRRLVADMVP